MRVDSRPIPRIVFWLIAGLLIVTTQSITRAQTSEEKKTSAGLQSPTAQQPADDAQAKPQDLNIKTLFKAGGVVGMIIIALSVAMVALIVEHLLSIRRSALMPYGLAEEVHGLILEGKFREAEETCHNHPSFLGHVLASGVTEAELDYAAVEKSMEDAATEQSARLFRKIEFLNVIGTLAPMLGLMGTVWGMIQAFHTFQLSTNPQVSELAPKISTALVTTLLGLMVAVPALGAFAMFRNRIDELVAESSLMAEHVFADYRRNLILRKKASSGARKRPPETKSANVSQ
ncbi:MAG: MotA/TolQ/ExbB proton channel family protein [Planctomycetaceae bacterium]|nr:MotA/TolQ/ExbB proton channel family protein [Planctomycetaceae bacterium]